MSRLGCITLALALGCRSPADEVGGITCDADELLDGDRCVPVACGQGTWGNLDEGDDAVYVDADAPDGGDGSRDAPLQRIDQALAVAEADGQVLIAAGTYTDGLEITSGGVDLRGRCSALVTLDGGELDDTPILQVNSDADARSTLQGVTVTDSYWGVDVRRGTLRVAYASLVGNRELGAYASDKRGVGTTLILDHVEINETQPGEEGLGYGLATGYDADLQVWDSVLRDNAIVGGYVSGGTARFERSEIVGTEMSEDGAYGMGLLAVEATLTVRDLVLSENHSIGLQLQNTAADMEGLTIASTDMTLSGEDGLGMLADGCEINLTNSRVEGNHSIGVSLGNGSTVMQGVSIIGTDPNEEGLYGMGLYVVDDSLVADGLDLEDNTGQGLLSGRASLTLSDVSVQDTHPGTYPDFPYISGALGGEGIYILAGSASLSQVTIEGSSSAGLLGALTLLDLQDVKILDTSADAAGNRGTGFEVWNSTVRGDTIYVEYFDSIGIGIGGSDVVLGDVTIQNQNQNAQKTGVGLAMVDSFANDSLRHSTLTSDNLFIQGIAGAGLFSQHGELALSNTRVEDITPDAEGRFGRGVELDQDSTLSSFDLVVRSTYEAAVSVGQFSIAEFTRTRISDTHLGARTALAVGAFVSNGTLRGGLDIADTEGVGIYGHYSDIACTGCFIHDSSFAAVVQQGGSLRLQSSTIAGVKESDIGGGAGLVSLGDGALRKADLQMFDVTITDVLRTSIYLSGTGSFEISNSSLSGGYGTDQTCSPRGNAVFAISGPDPGALGVGSGVLLDHNQIQGATEAAIFLHDATATLQDNTYQDNALDLLQQACLDGLPPPEGWEDETSAVELCPTYASPISEFEFYLYLPALELEE